MDQLFAPWRIEWVERDEDPSEGESGADASGGSEDECVFCAFADSEADRENRVVARSEHAFVLLNNYPYSPGHAMVVPNRHVEAYEALSEPELLDHALLTQRTLRAVETAFDPDGANVGYNLGPGAGGSIAHLHGHVVPRWKGDTNFMATIGDTQVIVEALADSYDRFQEVFAAQENAERNGDERAVRIG